MSFQTQHPLPVKSTILHTIVNSVNGPQTNSPKLKRLSVVFWFWVAIEFLTIAISAYFASVLYHDASVASFGAMPSLKEYIIEALFVAASFTVISLGFRHFGMAQRLQLHLLLWSGIGAVILAFVAFLATIFMLKMSGDYSRGAFLFQIVGVSIAICTCRALSHLWLRSAFASNSIEARRAILIGDTDFYGEITEELKSGGIRVVDSFPFPRESKTADENGNEIPYGLNRKIRVVTNLCRARQPDDIVILTTQKDLSVASDLAHYLSTLPCDIHISPIDTIKFLTRSQIAELGVVRTLRVSRRPLSIVDLAIKRTFDIFVASIALIALSPLLLVTAIAIKLDSKGNIIYRQLRHGYNNKEIRVFKFRSMTAADKNDGVFTPTRKNDDRVTTVGQILRKTNIDELPQLINVLFGEMSIVGPRPHATKHNEIFEEQILPFARRHNVKPGITGWAQVNGYRGPADTLEIMQRRVDYDLYYIDNWSFFFDLKIILMTFFSRKAYRNAF
jgi:Undecaprenyl-phosphate glucose phosphotransferase